MTLRVPTEAVPAPGRNHQHFSPRQRDEVLFQVSNDDPTQIDAAVQKAARAMQLGQPSVLADRSHALDRLAGLIETAAGPLARQMAIELGKPINQGREEVQRAAANIRDALSRARSAAREWAEGPGVIRRTPLGVVALISPWNNPVAIPLGKIAPALAYGNTVVWKPAPAATGVALTIQRLLTEAGLPAGPVELITGDHTVAQALAECRDIAAITITGSLAAGRCMQAIASERFLPLQAELSGNNAAIVWDDAPWEHAAREIAWGAFGFAGQRCTANRRAIVPRPRVKDFVSAVRTAAEQLRWGDPLDETTDIGPVVDQAKRVQHDTLIGRAKAELGTPNVFPLCDQLASDPHLQTGNYAQPVLIVCDAPEHPLVQEETMSPLLVVQPADDFEHALALCNGVRHGLAAALFSDAEMLRARFAAGAEAGILKFNSSTAGVDVRLPFGGCKASSLGPPEHGDADVQFYTRWQAVYGWNAR